MRIRAAMIVGFVVRCVFMGSDAVAAELPAGVFQMKDGAYFRPADGFLTTNLDEMLLHVSSTLVTTSTSDVQPPVAVSFPLKLAIGRAQQLLSATTTPPHVENSDTGFRDVALALWDPKTDALRVVDVKKKGRELKIVSADAPKITVVRSNGINSEFAVATGEVVVAVRYPIYADRKISKTKTVYDVSDAVYTPYSRALHTTEMVAEGKRWLDETVMDVFERLRTEGVPSRSAPAASLADAVDPGFVKRVMLIEHLDEGALKRDAARQIESFLVTLAANEDDAYDYSKSKAGALGLVQFIPKTYAAIAKWPLLNLEKNFENGMRDPMNALRAQTAYLDYLRSRLPIEEVATSTDQSRVEEYVAAAYNGGATRAAKAMALWDENLDPDERLHVRSRSRLKLETMRYVLKLRLVRDADLL